MEEVFDDLKKNEILHPKNVQALRNYIDQKYPYYTKASTSAIFADAVHKIIDQNIHQFNEETKPDIKKNLFLEVSKKETFSINALEIYDACSKIYIDDHQYISALTDWINQNQRLELPQESVVELTKDYIHNQTSPIIPFVEPISIPRDIANPLILMEPTIPFEPYIPTENIPLRKNTHQILIGALLGSGSLLFIFVIALSFRLVNDTEEMNSSMDTTVAITEYSAFNTEGTVTLPDEDSKDISYVPVNEASLQEWLNEKDSLLVDEPYFSAILTAAKDYDIHPLLLFAITGQEQSFVRRDHPYAKEIANNPFNVFGSWEIYNTDITDAASVAAKTVSNLSLDCPEETDIIEWINRKYAEDPHWHVGVTSIFHQLKEEIPIQ